MSIYFFYGDEDYNIELAVNEKKSVLDKDFGGMNFKTYDNPRIPDLISILRTTPMMFGKMLIVINCESYFAKTFEDKELKQVEEALELVSENVDVIFTAVLPRNENKKIDSRRKIYKILSKYIIEEFMTIKTYKIEEIVNWLNIQAKETCIKLEKDAAYALVEQIGNNLREFAQELEKLKLAAYPEKTITKELVKDICVTNEDLFVFTDYIMCGKTDFALLEFKKLLSKKHELEILSALQTMLRKWILIKMNAKSRSMFEISKLTGLHEFVIKNNLKKMEKHSLKDLIRLKQNLLNAEYKIKSGQSIDTKGEIENAIIR